MRHMADHRCHLVMSLFIQLGRFSSGQLYQLPKPLHQCRWRVRQWRKNKPLVAKQIGLGRLHAATLASGHRMAADVVDVLRQQTADFLHEPTFGTAHIGQHRARFHHRQDSFCHWQHLQHRRAEKNEVRILHSRLRRLRQLIDRTHLQRQFSRRRPPGKAGHFHLLWSGLTQSQPQRATDQSQTENRHPCSAHV